MRDSRLGVANPLGVSSLGVGNLGVSNLGGKAWFPLTISGIELLGRIDSNGVRPIAGAVASMAELTGNHTIVQATAGERPAYSNGLITFDGIDNHFDIGTNVDIDTNDIFIFLRATIPDIVAATHRLFGSDNSAQFSLSVGANGKITTALAGANHVSIGTAIDDGTEHFFCFNYDRSANLSIFIDDMSTADDTIDISGTVAVDIPAMALAIGADGDASQPLAATFKGDFGMGVGHLLTELERIKLKASR